jgi:hypothetical protein
MEGIRDRWLAFYSAHMEQASKEIFSHVEKVIIGTLIVSAGAHVSSADPAIELFGYLRHSLVGRGVELFLSTWHPTTLTASIWPCPVSCERVSTFRGGCSA